MLTKVTINSKDRSVNLSVYVYPQKCITNTLLSAYTSLAAISELSFNFDESFYTLNNIRYGISSSGVAYRLKY